MKLLKTGKLTEDLHPFLTGEEVGELGDRFLTLVHTSDRVFFSLEKKRDLSVPLRALSIESLRELRAFNESGELRLWKSGGDIGWRLRIDDGSENANIYDEEHVLWGDKIAGESAEGLILRESGRGFSFRVPPFGRTPSLPLKLLVRNYYDFEEDGLLHFFDARLVSLKDQDGRDVECRV